MIQTLKGNKPSPTGSQANTEEEQQQKGEGQEKSPPEAANHKDHAGSSSLCGSKSPSHKYGRQHRKKNLSGKVPRSAFRDLEMSPSCCSAFVAQMLLKGSPGTRPCCFQTPEKERERQKAVEFEIGTWVPTLLDGSPRAILCRETSRVI